MAIHGLWVLVLEEPNNEQKTIPVPFLVLSTNSYTIEHDFVGNDVFFSVSSEEFY